MCLVRFDPFDFDQAMYIRVVRREGPQLSLIDLPGITHNASKMNNIYEAGTGVQNPKDHKQICPLQDGLFDIS